MPCVQRQSNQDLPGLPEQVRYKELVGDGSREAVLQVRHLAPGRCAA